MVKGSKVLIHSKFELMGSAELIEYFVQLFPEELLVRASKIVARLFLCPLNVQPCGGEKRHQKNIKLTRRGHKEAREEAREREYPTETLEENGGQLPRKGRGEQEQGSTSIYTGEMGQEMC
ncbi:hypothetical protein cyc_05161 [Cyclospora cayetanensis]|uniref:Uncharacterized protein n=1 Tax=Cyclospora cayetanensis TaxID=88456 RepID=A0A1D3D2B4_9EIME|nr:hypothetical protein cyc_05161 [Cyclospora cayetanensis]